MAERTREQILDQAVYAAACVARHYGSGFSDDGLVELRQLLSHMPWETDSCYRVDVYEDDPRADFYPSVLNVDDEFHFNYDYITRASKGQLVEGKDYIKG